MGSVFAQIAAAALAVTNEVMGVSCLYTNRRTNAVIESVMVVINKNKKVTDEFKNLVGYRNEANVLKSQVPGRPNIGDTVTDPDGVTWILGELTLDTETKWYIDVRKQ